MTEAERYEVAVMSDALEEKRLLYEAAVASSGDVLVARAAYLRAIDELTGLQARIAARSAAT